MGNCNCNCTDPETNEMQTNNRTLSTNEHKLAHRMLKNAVEEDPSLLTDGNKKNGYGSTQGSTYDQNAPRPDAIKLTTIPDYSNPYTSETMKKLGPFVFDNDDPSDANLPEFGPYEIENNSVYIGQWKSG